MRRPALVLSGLGFVAIFVAYLTVRVPVDIPMHMGEEARRYWPVALAAGAAMFTTAAFVMAWARSRVRAGASASTALAAPAAAVLRFQSLPLFAVAGVAAISWLLASMAAMHGMPLWSIVLAGLAPWVPVIGLEAAWKHQHYGVFALLWLLTLLQVGHMGEHSAQVSQLLMTNGDLDRSHGVFGALDFETVHFYWDSTIWVITALLLHRFVRNPWLWVAFGAASLHQMEHVYLYFVYLADMDFYASGGLAGILGKGGVIGSPLARPYLHFTYNLCVTVPMVLALWHESRRVADRVAEVASGGAPRSAHPEALVG